MRALLACTLALLIAAARSAEEVVVTQNAARVLVLILSDTRTGSAALRSSARSSWLGLLPVGQVRHFFCLGNSDSGRRESELNREAGQYGDLVRTNVPDSYEDLSHKVFACIVHAASVVGDFDFLIKTDHDVFLRLDIIAPELADLLSRHEAERRVPLLHWQGFAYHSVPPMRDLSDKNADVSNTMLTFPPYTAGVAYILSATLVEELAAIEAPAFLLNEDQTLGVWVEQHVLHGGRRVLPVHDIRFQQWDVCNAGQIAHHFMTNSVRRMTLAISNMQNGKPACAIHAEKPCCLCCDCVDSRASWFRCDERGAFLYMLNPVSQALAAVPPSDPRLQPAWIPADPRELFELIRATHPLACSWAPMSWAALGVASIAHTGSRDGIILSCPAAPAVRFDAGRHFCASQLSYLPANEGRSEPCPPESQLVDISRHVGLHESASNFGIAGQCRNIGRSEMAEGIDDSWLLASAWVETAGACMLDGLDAEMRAQMLSMDRGYTGPPRTGSPASFCGLLIDVMHEDGKTATWPLSFARNASRHFHAEVFRVSNPSRVVRASVTVVVPAAGGESSMTIAELSLRKLRFSDGRGDDVTRAASMALSTYACHLDPRQPRFGLGSSWLRQDNFSDLAMLGCFFSLGLLLWFRNLKLKKSRRIE